MARKQLLVELINYSSQFIGDIEKWTKDEGIDGNGYDFSVVTVLGCQSSGKSTLLNNMFGTGFETLDSSQGRQQTTKGLWIGKDSETPTIVIDVEGTDSCERGEDRATFEHRAALFSLSVADVLIINMWYHDIGRYSGSNMGLLKTVLEVNLELFQQDQLQKTVLYFVIRDHSEKQTPLVKLEAMIHKDVRHAWKEIRKPEKYEISEVDDFFDFRVEGLPSYFSNRPEFVETVQRIRQDWLQKVRPKQYSRNIPADGFAFFSRNIWKAIVSSESLDIPSQKEMLAAYRCEEIKQMILLISGDQIRDTLHQTTEKAIPNFVFWAEHLMAACIRKYDESADRYQGAATCEKRKELIESITKDIQRVVVAHLGHKREELVKSALATFEKSLKLAEDNNTLLKLWSSFETVRTAAEDEVVRDLRVEGEEMQLSFKGAVAFEYEEVVDSARERFNSSIEIVKQQQTSRLREVLNLFVAGELSRFDLLLSAPTLKKDTLWIEFTRVLTETKLALTERVEAAFTGLLGKSEDAESETTQNFVGRECLKVGRMKLDKEVEYLDMRIVRLFQQLFQHDKDGIPRYWPSVSQEFIKQCYKESKQTASELLDVFSEFPVKLSDFLPTLSEIEAADIAKIVQTPLLTTSRKEVIQEKADQAMAKACQEAQVMQATGMSRGNIPIWIYGLLILLGWNEVMLVLSSPIFLIIALISLGVIAVSYATGNTRLPFELTRQCLGAGATVVLPLMHQLQQALTGTATSLSTIDQASHLSSSSAAAKKSEGNKKGK